MRKNRKEVKRIEEIKNHFWFDDDWRPVITMLGGFHRGEPNMEKDIRGPVSKDINFNPLDLVEAIRDKTENPDDIFHQMLLLSAETIGEIDRETRELEMFKKRYKAIEKDMWDEMIHLLKEEQDELYKNVELAFGVCMVEEGRLIKQITKLWKESEMVSYKPDLALRIRISKAVLSICIASPDITTKLPDFLFELPVEWLKNNRMLARSDAREAQDEILSSSSLFAEVIAEKRGKIITKLLEDYENWYVRADAAYTLGQIANSSKQAADIISKDAIESLVYLFFKDHTSEVHVSILSAFGKIGSKSPDAARLLSEEYIDIFTQSLTSLNREVYKASVKALTIIATWYPEVIEILENHRSRYRNLVNYYLNRTIYQTTFKTNFEKLINPIIERCRKHNLQRRSLISLPNFYGAAFELYEISVKSSQKTKLLIAKITRELFEELFNDLCKKSNPIDIHWYAGLSCVFYVVYSCEKVVKKIEKVGKIIIDNSLEHFTDYLCYKESQSKSKYKIVEDELQVSLIATESLGRIAILSHYASEVIIENVIKNIFGLNKKDPFIDLKLNSVLWQIAYSSTKAAEVIGEEYKRRIIELSKVRDYYEIFNHDLGRLFVGTTPNLAYADFKAIKRIWEKVILIIKKVLSEKDWNLLPPEFMSSLRCVANFSSKILKMTISNIGDLLIETLESNQKKFKIVNESARRTSQINIAIFLSEIKETSTQGMKFLKEKGIYSLIRLSDSEDYYTKTAAIRALREITSKTKIPIIKV